jgi:hypothetical protein
MGEIKQTLLEKIEFVDRRIIYIVIILLIAIPDLAPSLIPVTPTPGQMTIDAYDEMMKLTPDSTVIWMLSLAGNSWPEMGPPSIDIWRILYHDVQCKIVMVHISKMAAEFYMQWLFPRFFPEAFDTYGTQWVNLGFVAGDETALAAISRDIRSVISSDFFGTPIDDLPLMTGINDYSHFDALFAAGEAMFQRQFWAYQPDIPIISATFATGLPIIEPYYATGAIDGILAGSKGAAELEYIIGEPGLGYGRYQAITTTNTFLLAAIAFGNIITVIVLVSKKGGKKE